MSTKIFSFFALLFAIQAQASDAKVEFRGTVRRDGTRAIPFDVSVPAGAISKLMLQNGAILEFGAAAAQGIPKQSVVRLMDEAGNPLHPSTTPGNAPLLKSIRYTICGKRVIFQNPSSLPEVTCSS
jgi:hypothetical protein